MMVERCRVPCRGQKAGRPGQVVGPCTVLVAVCNAEWGDLAGANTLGK